MVKKGQWEVSKADSPKQGEDRDPKAERVDHGGKGSRSQTRAKPPGEGSGSDGS